jgi:hypothetical protein
MGMQQLGGEEVRDAATILVGKPGETKSSVRRRQRWENNTKTDLKYVCLYYFARLILIRIGSSVGLL